MNKLLLIQKFVARAIARALIGGGGGEGVYIHAYISIMPEINPNNNSFQKKLVGHNTPPPSQLTL